MESTHWEKREAQTMQWTNMFWVWAIVWIALSSPIVSWAQAEEVTEVGTKMMQGFEITWLFGISRSNVALEK